MPRALPGQIPPCIDGELFNQLFQCEAGDCPAAEAQWLQSQAFRNAFTNLPLCVGYWPASACPTPAERAENVELIADCLLDRESGAECLIVTNGFLAGATEKDCPGLLAEARARAEAKQRNKTIFWVGAVGGTVLLVWWWKRKK